MIDADYLIVGAGAAGMAFADSLVTHSEATMVIADRRDRPGGHWNDAYPFIRVHQPAATYGVSSRALDSGRKDESGPNQGLYELASGQEVLSHFDTVMRHRLLPSGRVRYLPMSDVGADGVVTSLLSGKRHAVQARKTVDTTYSQITVPAQRPPQFPVADSIRIVPPNDLPRLAPQYGRFTVIGAGKTGMDTCIWLLENGADPDRIRWIMPRDPWLLDRANFQPGDEFFERSVKSLADQVEALARAESPADLFARLEAAGEVRRIHQTVEPRAFHCATVSDGELDRLRRIRDVVRQGRVTRIDADQIVLEQGIARTGPESLHVDCTANGIPWLPGKPVFDGARITPQYVRMCQPAFSAALLGFVEVTFGDDDEKNALCAPIPPPQVPLDWLRMMSVELANRYRWSKSPQIDAWIAQTRLDNLSKRLQSLTGTETEVLAHLQRYLENVGAAVKNVGRLLADAEDLAV